MYPTGQLPQLDGYFTKVSYSTQRSRDIPYDLAVIPSLSKYQRSCREAKNTASGVDGIPGALLHAFAPEIATLSYPLVLKFALTGVEPIQWKGGVL